MMLMRTCGRGSSNTALREQIDGQSTPPSYCQLPKVDTADPVPPCKADMHGRTPVCRLSLTLVLLRLTGTAQPQHHINTAGSRSVCQHLATLTDHQLPVGDSSLFAQLLVAFFGLLKVRHNLLCHSPPCQSAPHSWRSGAPPPSPCGLVQPGRWAGSPAHHPGRLSCSRVPPTGPGAVEAESDFQFLSVCIPGTPETSAR